MARSTTVVAAGLLVTAALVALMSSPASAQYSSSQFDCDQSCINECVARKEEPDCPRSCKEVCVEMEQIMARSAADKDCPLQCYESCMIQSQQEGKAGCTSNCKKFCNISSDEEFAARLNPNSKTMK